MLDEMATIKKRLGASVFLTILSLASLVLLLVRSNRLGGSPDEYTDLLGWKGSDENEDFSTRGGDGPRMVVFGDSWVADAAQEEEEGKGKSWTEVLCDEV